MISDLTGLIFTSIRARKCSMVPKHWTNQFVAYKCLFWPHRAWFWSSRSIENWILHKLHYFTCPYEPGNAQWCQNGDGCVLWIWYGYGYDTDMIWICYSTVQKPARCRPDVRPDILKNSWGFLWILKNSYEFDFAFAHGPGFTPFLYLGCVGGWVQDPT